MQQLRGQNIGVDCTELGFMAGDIGMYSFTGQGVKGAEAVEQAVRGRFQGVAISARCLILEVLEQSISVLVIRQGMPITGDKHAGNRLDDIHYSLKYSATRTDCLRQKFGGLRIRGRIGCFMQAPERSIELIEDLWGSVC